MAAAQDLQDLEDCLNVCGLQAAQEIAGIIIREGYESLEEFSQLRPDDVPGMAKNLRTRPAAQRAHYSDRQIRALSALLYWLNERNSTGQALDAALWTPALLREIQEKMRAEKDAPSPPSATTLNKFDSILYESSIDHLRNYLKQLKLAPFVREENPPTVFADEEEMKMYQYRFDTPTAKEENRQVYRILKGYFIETDARAWLKTYDATEDGRAGFLAVHKYFSGAGEKKKRITHAKQIITA